MNEEPQTQTHDTETPAIDPAFAAILDRVADGEGPTLKEKMEVLAAMGTHPIVRHGAKRGALRFLAAAALWASGVWSMAPHLPWWLRGSGVAMCGLGAYAALRVRRGMGEFL